MLEKDFPVYETARHDNKGTQLQSKIAFTGQEPIPGGLFTYVVIEHPRGGKFVGREGALTRRAFHNNYRKTEETISHARVRALIEYRTKLVNDDTKHLGRS